MNGCMYGVIVVQRVKDMDTQTHTHALTRVAANVAATFSSRLINGRVDGVSRFPPCC